MSFFGSKKRRQKSYIPKYETDITYQQNSERESKNKQVKTTMDIHGADFFPTGGSVTDQVKHLNQYINELVKENERLQNIVDDSKTTNLLSKQMLNDYVNKINEQGEEIQALKNENARLTDELHAYQK